MKHALHVRALALFIGVGHAGRRLSALAGRLHVEVGLNYVGIKVGIKQEFELCLFFAPA